MPKKNKNKNKQRNKFNISMPSTGVEQIAQILSPLGSSRFSITFENAEGSTVGVLQGKLQRGPRVQIGSKVLVSGLTNDKYEILYVMTQSEYNDMIKAPKDTSHKLQTSHTTPSKEEGAKEEEVVFTSSPEDPYEKPSCQPHMSSSVSKEELDAIQLQELQDLFLSM